MPGTVPPVPAAALQELVAQLRQEESVLASEVVDSELPAALGELAAAGPAAAANAAAYAVVVEAVREGYLLHYGEPRLFRAPDLELRLLAGDHLYALGLARLSALDDLVAVRLLADLISLGSQLHPNGGPANPAGETLWLATSVAIAAGTEQPLEPAKAAIRAGDPEAGAALEAGAREIAAAAGLEGALATAARGIGIDFPASDRLDLG